MDKIKVCVAGATGWAGSALSKGIVSTSDMQLVSAISRSHAGKTLGEVIGVDGPGPPYMPPPKRHYRPILMCWWNTQNRTRPSLMCWQRCEAAPMLIIGTSGLSNEDYEEIDALARQMNRGVLAVGNFALTVVLLQKFAEMAAKYIPHWEIIDYAHNEKRDAPSGTARELANRLSAIRESQLDVPLEETQGVRETRGARMQGTQVHSVRLPGYVISIDAIFGMPDQKLILRHESGTSAEPYVGGALLAIREVGKLAGLHRGLDSVMKF